MKRILYVVLLLVLTAEVAVSRTTMRQWFAAMPDSVMPLLTKNSRLDFVDFLDCGMEAVVTNRLDGKSQMKVLAEDYLSMSYTGVSDVEMKLLPVGDTADVLCMVTTMKTAVRDSRVEFFDKAWRPLDGKEFFTAPRLDDFRTAERNDSADVVWKKIDVFFKTFALSPDEAVLTCRLTALDYLNREDRKAVMPYVKAEAIEYRWVDGRFVLE